MFLLYANKVKLSVQQREPITSGSSRVHTVQFEFSGDWDGLSPIAYFRLGDKTVSVKLDETNSCAIPSSVTDKDSADQYLYAGVCGTDSSGVVLPTIWANLGYILKGASGESVPDTPFPDSWQEELDSKGDRLDYTNDGELGLYSGDTLLSSVPIEGGGGEGGTSDHRLLSHKDAEEQHPIKSITGLSEALERIPGPVEPLTNLELEEILK